jgi:hypothetical protein
MKGAEADDAIAGNMILVDRQFQSRRQPTASARQIRHHESPNPVSHRIPGENQHGPVAPGVPARRSSPLRIGPVAPLFGRTPISDVGQRRLLRA